MANVNGIACCLALHIFLTTIIALAAGCGLASRRHPPSLRLSANSIDGLSAGIVGGGEAEPHSYPWQAWIVRRESQTHGYQCGGTLLNNGWLLTAAHCVHYENSNRPATADMMRVFLGKQQTSTKLWEYGTRPSRIIVHPDYNREATGLLHNDVALIELPSYVQFTDKIQPICLPQSSDDFASTPANAVLVGWGSTYDYGYRGSAVLKQALVRTGRCGGQRQGAVCARGHSQGGCSGDSGGPLLLYRRNAFVLAGVLSAMEGNRCGAGSTVFMHVPHFSQWIRQQTGA